MSAVSPFNHKWPKILELVCSWGIAAVFLYSGVMKLFHLEDFITVVAAYGLVPEKVVPPVAFSIAVMEMVAAAGLLFRKRFGLYMTTILLAIFILVLSYGMALGLDIDCGCFTQGGAEHSAFSGLKTALLRDLLFFPPLAYLYFRYYT